MENSSLHDLLIEARRSDKEISLRLSDYLLLISRIKSKLTMPNLVLLCSIIEDICELNHSIGTYNSEKLDNSEENIVRLITIYKETNQYNFSKELETELNEYESQVQNFQKCVSNIQNSIPYKYPSVIIIFAAMSFAYILFKVLSDFD
ncbi:hypothetical protein TVAG_249830 [Trichomonas vaginalis G3]|uniref:Uncharacterized protein n=1 Tax=Trichomonas vaginalis (strain ATCC PRA-98 / G3) TaxID=412133 RepID=A2DCI6_TRIV3|nr:hypothetical protein TVAGG3_0956600 [Trichomonas vaginalis G3]EAY21923.1 hypothetical protein TVAG_249830 [Trichomonas vaginalis G3]KAI5487602.1 hypothetical protein TVAGG3_0956600 [Trichomonas vaginalis G3]|eukprot:XP_001582909.1 hypothetical protein [Trichomonas vaginalis G3]